MCWWVWCGGWACDIVHTLMEREWAPPTVDMEALMQAMHQVRVQAVYRASSGWYVCMWVWWAGV